MKVRVTLTVEVDPEVWMAEYGIERAGVREDVREYVTQGVAAQLQEVGVASLA